MLTRNDLTSMIRTLRYHHDAVKRLSVLVDAEHNVMRNYDRDDLTYHLIHREDLVQALSEFLRTGISPPYTIGVDREAQIDAFLTPAFSAVAAE